MIRVLLIDNEPLPELITHAKVKYDIEILQFYNLKSAKENLKKNEHYKAVILDCYCALDDSNTEQIDFLNKAIALIGGSIPWYILSGGTAKDDFPTIIKLLTPDTEARPAWKQWDPENEKGFYSKTGGLNEYDTLLSRIADLDKDRNDVITQYKRYVDIIKRCCQGPPSKDSKCKCLSDEIIDKLIRILMPIYHNKLEDCSDKDMGGYFRSCLENFLKSCLINGTMPHCFDEVPDGPTVHKINCFVGNKYTSKNKEESTNAIGDSRKSKKEIEANPKRRKMTPPFVFGILDHMREIGNCFADHPDLINESLKRYKGCGCFWKNQFVSCCFNFLDLLLWYDLEFDHLKENAEECRRIKEEEKDTNQQVTKNILSESEKLVDYDASSVSNILQTEISDKNDDLQEPLMSSIQQDEEAEDCTTLDTNESLNVELKSPECHQADIPQEDKGSDTIEARNSPPTNDNKKTYIVKSFKNRSGNTFRYIEYESRNALFDIEASVEEGDEIILMKVPIINSIDSLKLNYPLYIPKYSYKKVNK